MQNYLTDIIKAGGYRNIEEFAQIHDLDAKILNKNNQYPFNNWLGGKLIAKALNISYEELENKVTQPLIKPFIKWVGGKRRLLPELIKLAPKNYKDYYEPFIGGGAMLFQLKPKLPKHKIIINDLNQELINAWIQVKNNFYELEAQLYILQENDNKKNYLSIRNIDRTPDGLNKLTDVARAARFIYLNKAGYNGLYRVNKKGQNNVAYGGHKHLNLVPDFMIDDANYLVKNDVTILNGSYIDAIKSAKLDDFIYFDPPYIPATITSNFTSYTKEGFNFKDQQELANIAKELSKQGVQVMLSNADVPLIDKLYEKRYFEIHHVNINRMIGPNSAKRNRVSEVIITSRNYSY